MVLLSQAILLVACERMHDSTLHRAGFVKVRDGTRLHYLDWGGNGPPLVLLAGLGSSAHTFDDLAPQLTDSFRVIGITRRGTGESDRPATGYDVESRAKDDLDVLDSLKIGAAVFVGHSIAGDELTELASHYPQRVAGLVYLDAAYDRSTLPPMHPDDPVLTRPPSGPSASSFADALRLERKAPRGLKPAMETDLWETWRGKNGEIVLSPPAEIRLAMVDSAKNWHPDYRLIKAPATAIYAFSPTRPTQSTDLWHLDSAERAKWDSVWRTEHWSWQRQEIARFKSEDPSVNVIILNPAPHEVYFSNPKDVVAAIHAILPKLQNRNPARQKVGDLRSSQHVGIDGIGAKLAID
jgi:pimeloyl-ACP methyl ester carboxylesterase